MNNESVRYEELTPDEQILVNQVAYDAVLFRRPMEEFVERVHKEVKRLGVMSARERYREVKAKFDKQTPRNAAAEKEAQKERLLDHIRKTRDAKNWMALAKFESLYADLMGTREPIKVEHVLVGNLGSLLSQLTPERQAQIIAEQRRLHALAEAAEKNGLTARALPAGPIVDAEIVDE